MIQHSGARSLNEVFDIFVPNVQIMRHLLVPDIIGIRGIINYPPNKYLQLVNGHIVNLRSTEGAVTERDLPKLGDIYYIDVVREPGSVVYGPGAISGVINIVTYNGLNFEGSDVALRQDFIEQSSTLEFRHGQKIDEDSAVFFYLGIVDYDGADQDDSLYVFSKSFTTTTGEKVAGGDPVDFDITNDSVILQSWLTRGTVLVENDLPGEEGVAHFEVAASPDFSDAIRSA